jgi:DNA-binding MarR family transcriptional regulator
MLVLWEEDGVSVKALGERLALDSGTLTPLLKRMEQHGLVARRRDAEDERVVRIHLTAAGRKLRERAREVPLQIACSAGFDVGDAKERARLGRLREELVALAERIGAAEE